MVDNMSSGATGPGTSKAVDAIAQTIADIRSNMDAIAASTQKFARDMNKAAKSSIKIQRSTESISIPTANQHTTGSAQPQIGQESVGQTDSNNGAAQSRADISMRSRSGSGGGSLLTAGLSFVGRGAVAMANDFRPGIGSVMQFQQNSRIAFAGGVAHKDFGNLVEMGMNKYNVQDRAVFESDIATSIRSGWAQAYGSAENAAKQVGVGHSLAVAAGLSAEDALALHNAVQDPGVHYGLASLGVQTRDPYTGKMYSNENILEQIYQNDFLNLKNATVDEMIDAFRPGYQLDMTFAGMDPAAKAQIMAGLKMRMENGRPLTEGELEQAMEDAEVAGTEGTNALDSASDLRRSEQELLNEYIEDAALGIKDANDLLKTFNDELSGATGAVRDFLGAIATAGTFGDAFNATAPSTTSFIEDAIGTGIDLLGSYGLGKMLFGRGGGGRGGSGGSGGSNKAPGRLRGGIGSLFNNGAGGSPLRTMGKMAFGSAAIQTGGNWLTDQLQDKFASDDWRWWDSAGTIGATALTDGLSALALTKNPIVAAIFSLIGAVRGAVDSANKAEEINGGNSPSYSEGSFNIEKDMVANIHQGEMILPNRIAEGVRSELRRGLSHSGKVGAGVTINVTIQQASDAEAMAFAQRVKEILDQDRELSAAGYGSF